LPGGEDEDEIVEASEQIKSAMKETDMPERQFQVNKYIRMALSFLIGVLGVAIFFADSSTGPSLALVLREPAGLSQLSEL
jgi:hypothetical protein